MFRCTFYLGGAELTLPSSSGRNYVIHHGAGLDDPCLFGVPHGCGPVLAYCLEYVEGITFSKDSGMLNECVG